MTRRAFVTLAAAAPTANESPLVIPIHRITDAHARIPPDELRHFWTAIWPETVRDFGQGGMTLAATDGPGEIRYSAADKPIFTGLRRRVLNLVLTRDLPLYWDQARARAGAATIIDGYHVCVIALRYAHGDQAPFVSVNTCVHELLHALMQDVFVTKPKWYQVGTREFDADYYATLMWIFHDGTEVRQSARVYLRRIGATTGMWRPAER